MKRILVLGLAMALAACTKEVPYKEAPKDEQLTSKRVINTNSEFIYLVSNGEASRTSPSSIPFWMGDTKLVKLQFTEDSLQVLELDNTNLFRLNPTNNKVILEIPISHIDYECAKDQYGECTNQEEENKKLSWKDRAYFKPRFRDMKVTEVSVLPVELQNFFGYNCYQETSSRPLAYELSPDAVNIQIERTFRVNADCLSETTESLSDAVFSSVYHYSMVRVDTIASPNYQPIEYPRYDEGEMGFFTSTVKQLDPDNRDVVLGEKTFLNRWNPARGKIVYNLSKSFYRPHNQALLKATELGISRVNRALVQSNSGLQIELRDGSDLAEGDLRNNFIVLVDDPLAQGILGYGPSATNPVTGEILSGRVVMYAGTMKKFIRQTYDEFVEREQQTEARVSSASAPMSIDPSLLPESEKLPLAEILMSSEGQLGAINMKDIVQRVSLNKSTNIPLNVDRIKTDLTTYTKRVADRSDRLKDRLEAMSEHCAYPAELVNFEQAVADALKQITEGKLTPWDELGEAQKALIVDTVMPFVWVPTLVHEVGHNLGLRHNFAGSEDHAHYYTKEELAEFGIDHDITYSSVMDYPHRSLNELPAMGKYDIAALRFAYARQVEVPEKGMIPVATTLKDLDQELEEQGASRVSYRFCTDEHVSVNPGCKRFDEGKNFTEIAQHFVDTYHKEFRYRHMRNGLRNFSLFGDYASARRLNYTFNTLRVMFEIYERLNSEFNIPPDLWQTNAFLKDVRTATDIATMFFVQMINTPDTTCAVAQMSAPNKVVMAIPLEAIDREAMSCFDSEVQNVLIANGLLGVGEGGLSFKSKKDPKNDNPYTDQIDQRGIWIEKAMAVNYLYSRSLNNSIFDRHRKNFTHYSRYTPLTIQTTVNMLMNDVVSTTNFQMLNGQVLPLKISHSPLNTHKIVEPLDSRMKQLFNLPDDDSLFDQLILKTIAREVPSNIETENARAVSEIFEVYLSTDRSGHSPSDFESATIGSRRYFALKENLVALLAIRSINAQKDLSELKPERIQEILADIEAGKGPKPNDSDLEKRVYKLDPELIQAFVEKELQTIPELARLLSLLNRAI